MLITARQAGYQSLLAIVLSSVLSQPSSAADFRVWANGLATAIVSEYSAGFIPESRESFSVVEFNSIMPTQAAVADAAYLAPSGNQAHVHSELNLSMTMGMIRATAMTAGTATRVTEEPRFNRAVDFFGGAAAEFGWDDVIFIHGPPGQDLDFRVSLDLDSTTSVVPFVGEAYADLILRVQIGRGLEVNDRLFGPAWFNEMPFVNGIRRDDELVLHAEAGDQFFVSATGSIQTNHGIDTFNNLMTPGSASAAAQVVANNTMSFRIDPITPGASYSTASGVSYLTNPLPAVPEPSEYLLLLAGLGLVVAVARRRAVVAPADRLA